MEPEPHKAPIRFYEIDLLRFLAALSVVLYHYTYQGYIVGDNSIQFVSLGSITKYFYLGVELFFIISGYVVLLSAQGKSVRQFFFSRVTRLYPAFWVCCTLTFLVKRLWGPGPGDTHMASHLQAGFGQYLYNMTMLHEFLGVPPIDGPYWSLTVEITFYFLISLLISYKLMKQVDWFMLGWLGYAMLPKLPHLGTPFSTLFFPSYAPYFIAGMLFYLMQRPQGRSRFRYALLALTYIAAIRSSFNQVAEIEVFHHVVFSRLVVGSIVTSFFITFYLVAFQKINLVRFTWLSWLGALTYPLYLIHSDIGYIVFHHIGPLVDKYMLVSGTLLLMLLVAYLVHVLVEKRFGKALGIQLNKWAAKMEQNAGSGLPEKQEQNPKPVLVNTDAV